MSIISRSEIFQIANQLAEMHSQIVGNKPKLDVSRKQNTPNFPKIWRVLFS